MRGNNTRYQTLPIYNSKKEWFLYEHGFEFAKLMISSGRVPPMQFLDASKTNFEVYKIDDINDPLGSSTLIDTLTFTNETVDFYNDGNDIDISSFHPTGNIFSALPDNWYYIELDSGEFSEPFHVCKTLNRYKIEWSNSCDHNMAYYDTGWKNELWFDENLIFNAFKNEEEVEKNANGDVIGQKITKRYSFTTIIPEYLLDPLSALNSHDTVTIDDFETGTQISIHDIAVVDESGEKEKFTTVTVSFRIVGEVTPDNLGCCTAIEFIDDEVEAPGGGGSCPGFAVTIAEAAGELTYSLDSEPVDGSLVVAWSKDGASIGSGSTVSLGGFGTYKITVRKNGCTVTDSYIYLDPCELFFLNVTQDEGIINANTVGAPDTVTYKVYDETSTLVSSSLPYTAVTNGVHTIVATSGDCERQQNIDINLDDSCVHTAEIVRNGSQLTGSSDDGTATHNWHVDTGNGFGSSLSTSAVLNMSQNGYYRYTATVDGCEKYAYLTVVDLALSVEVANLIDIANASGDIQIIENTTGNVFDLDYDPSRWLLFRNGDDMTYREGVSAASLDVNEYDVVDGQLITSSIFPLTIDDVIKIKPV